MTITGTTKKNNRETLHNSGKNCENLKTSKFTKAVNFNNNNNNFITTLSLAKQFTIKKTKL